MKRTLVVLSLLACAVALARPPHEGKFPLFPRDSGQDLDSTHHFDVRFYRIDLNTTVLSGAFTARCRIELTPRHDNFDTFSLHMVSLVCDSIRRDGNACTFTTPSGRLLVDLDRPFNNGESLAVDIYYHRNSGTQNRGYYWYAKGTSGIPHAVAYSVTETDDSRYWFPCFDQPWDKAERGCQINLTVPDSFSSCANGSLDSVSYSGGRRTDWWTHRFPISTYLMCFASSKFTNWQTWFRHGADSMPVRYYVWPEDSTLAVGSFALMNDMLAYYSSDSIYGLYPFIGEKYGMVAVYPYPWGGMEHQTMTTIHRSWARNGDVDGIAHELAHQWWGDMVTCVDWRNIWLNEGFATYSDMLYTLHWQGLGAFRSVLAERAQYYFTEEASDFHPIYDPPAGHEFDWGHSYCKGAWVQHMLRYVMGDTMLSRPGRFFKMLQQYGDSFRFGNAATHEYQRIASRASGLDLGWFFDEWVYHGGYPQYRVGWHGRQTADGWQVVINLSQNNGGQAPSCFHIPVEVKVSFASGDTVIRYDVSANPQLDAFAVRAQPTGVTFDPNTWILGTNTVQVGVGDEFVPGVPFASVSLGQSPSRSRPVVRYELPGTRDVRLSVCDLSGRVVRELVNASVRGGRYSVAWDRLDASGARVPAGVYVVRLEAGSERAAAKLVLAD